MILRSEPNLKLAPANSYSRWVQRFTHVKRINVRPRAQV